MKEDKQHRVIKAQIAHLTGDLKLELFKAHKADMKSRFLVRDKHLTEANKLKLSIQKLKEKIAWLEDDSS